MCGVGKTRYFEQNASMAQMALTVAALLQASG